MRICLRKFESSEIANIYVFDEQQAEYLRDRFGGCLEFRHIPGVVESKASKGGRPKKPEGEALSALQKKRNQRARERDANKAAKAELLADDQAGQLDIGDRSRDQMQKSRSE